MKLPKPTKADILRAYREQKAADTRPVRKMKKGKSKRK